ncbi:hypothetical protein VPH35_111645 [Triticum aestivum]
MQKAPRRQSSWMPRIQKLSRRPSLQTDGCYEVHDIEDLPRVGRQVKGCPYFAAQTMAKAVELSGEQWTLISLAQLLFSMKRMEWSRPSGCLQISRRREEGS